MRSGILLGYYLKALGELEQLRHFYYGTTKEGADPNKVAMRADMENKLLVIIGVLNCLVVNLVEHKIAHDYSVLFDGTLANKCRRETEKIWGKIRKTYDISRSDEFYKDRFKVGHELVAEIAKALSV